MIDAATLSAALLLLLALALVAAAATDLKARIIPNRLNLAVALAAPAWWWASGLASPDMAVQVALGIAVFAIFAGLFALGVMGGGDVKLLGALALWLPLRPLAEMLFMMALAGGAVTVAAMAWHRLRRAQGEVEVPYGVAIAGAGLWVISARYLNHLI